MSVSFACALTHGNLRCVQAMILAAGLGTRLWPLTFQRAKPAVPFLGVPLVRRIADRLAAQGFDRIVVNLHHLPDTVSQALIGRSEVVFSFETEILGTAGGIARARDAGLFDPDRPLLVVNGKVETDADFAKLVRAHAEHPRDVTLLLARNRAREAFREVYVDRDRVVGFGPGRQPETSDPLCFTGIHVLGPPAIARTRAEFSDTVRQIYPEFLDRGRLRAHLHGGRWWEFSTPERYLGLHQRVDPDLPGASVVWGELDPRVQVRGCVITAPEAVPPGDYADEVLAPAAAADAPPEGVLPPGARVEGPLLRVPLDAAAVDRARTP